MRSSYKLTIIATVVCPIVFAMYAPTFARIGRNIESSQTAKYIATGQNAMGFSQQPTPDFSKNKWEIPADADQTKNPIPSSEESIARGKEIFMGRKASCTFCHGTTGSGNVENLPKLRRKPADLSDSKRMPTLSDGELYWKITKGITGIMPSSNDPKFTAEERWDLVNFVRTLSRPGQ